MTVTAKHTLTLLLLLVVPEGIAADAPDVYATQIKPLLRGRCFSCHGSLKQEAGLRLDTAVLMVAGGESGPAIVRQDAAKSLLLKRISATDIADRMPPEDEGEPLSAEQIALIRNWITAGATAPSERALGVPAGCSSGRTRHQIGLDQKPNRRVSDTRTPTAGPDSTATGTANPSAQASAFGPGWDSAHPGRDLGV